MFFNFHFGRLRVCLRSVFFVAFTKYELLVQL